MSTTGRPFFDQFLNDYFAESEEHLSSARNRMLSLEASGVNKPVETNLLDDLLRDFHSLKGLSAMVGLEEATQLAHHIEDYLKELKRPDTVISMEGIDSVVAGITAIEQVVEAKRRSSSPPDVSLTLLHLQAVAEEVRTKPRSMAKSAANLWRFLFRSSPELAERGVTVNAVREQLHKIGQILRASPQVLDGGRVAFEFTVLANVPEAAFSDLRSLGIDFERIRENVPPPAADRPAVPDLETTKVPAHNFIRVEMNRLDDLMRIVGELMISRFQLDEVLQRGAKAEAWSAIEEINGSMERQLRELREKVVRSRMVPVGQVFERMRFAIRGLERELNKTVELRIAGHDTEIDKVVVERMMDPLLHLVRNAISHGLESAEERTGRGKPAAGTIALSAKTAGDVVVIEVEDDGRGIDAAAVTSRARRQGLIGKDETLEPQRLLEIISSPGFTTRDEADLTSGRGIGMAAVKTVVSELGGSINMLTSQGKGTRFTIRLPLTLLIADSLMVHVGSNRFAVLQTAVQEVLAVDSASIKVLENNEIVPFRGGVLPLIRLAELFRIDTEKRERLHVLVVANGDSPVGLAVDRITGQREIVVRSITDALLRVPGVVGATELGDGKPVLILDPHSLVWSARNLNMVRTA
jgi:two-component system chemotaxis sensor kinase CheA